MRCFPHIFPPTNFSLSLILLKKMTEVRSNVKMGQSDSAFPEESEGTLEKAEISESTCSSSSKPLEWNFLDFSKIKKCPIFEVDPVMLKKFIGFNVTVVNSSNEKFHGCCLAIDPVSLSVILARRTAGKIRVITLPGYHLVKIFVNPEAVPEDECVSVNDLDIAELYHAKSLLSESSQEPPEEKSNSKDEDTPVYSDEDIQRRKQILIELLMKNCMPCNDKGGELELPGGVRILPPYTPESCDTKGNKIIQRKLGELIKTIKDVNSDSDNNMKIS